MGAALIGGLLPLSVRWAEAPVGSAPPEHLPSPAPVDALLALAANAQAVDVPILDIDAELNRPLPSTVMEYVTDPGERTMLLDPARRAPIALPGPPHRLEP